MSDKCNCELERTICPNQRDLVGSDLYPNMSCEAIIKGLISMEKRIRGNADAAGIEGLTNAERENFEMTQMILENTVIKERTL